MSEDQFQTLKTMIEQMRSSMEARFEHVESRFEQVDKRFEHVDRRFQKVDDKLLDLDKDIMRIDAVLATKPDTGAIYTVAFSMMIGTVGMLVGAIVVANILGVLG